MGDDDIGKGVGVGRLRNFPVLLRVLIVGHYGSGFEG